MGLYESERNMISEALISTLFDSESIEAIHKLLSFDSQMRSQLDAALKDIGELVVQTAVSNTWTAFKNPTGELASTIQYLISGTMELVVGSNSPYSRRLEEGFTGTDILGRSYNQPAEPYLLPAVISNEDKIAELLYQYISNGFSIGGS
jgi:hypothetical protein